MVARGAAFAWFIQAFCTFPAAKGQARDAGGDSCTWYNTRQHLCGCCDTEEFSSYNCPACYSYSGSGPTSNLPLSRVLAAFPHWKTTAIRLSYFEIFGPFPELQETWPMLRALDLARNSINGTLPDFRRFPALADLRLSSNFLEGPIPASMGALPLTNVDLSSNKLSGALPVELGACADMDFFSVQNNALSGGIPKELGNWSNLTFVDLGANRLEGRLPVELAAWRKVTSVSLFGNALSGGIPKELAAWGEVTHVWLQVNRLDGSIPAELGEGWGKLMSLRIEDNRVEGELPKEIGRWQALEEFRLSKNRLSGPLPKEMGQWTRVATVQLQNNLLEGEIPRELGAWRSVVHVDLSHNKLVGAIPTELASWSLVQYVALENNGLSERIPAELAAWRRVQEVHLGENMLEGAIPPELGSWSRVRVVNLRNNRLTGGIPVKLADWSKLEDVDFSLNKLRGSLPPELARWTRAKTVIMNDVGLQGAIPAQFAAWRDVYLVVFANNNLTGEIPSSIGAWQALEEVYLAFNSLSGRIPTELCSCPYLTTLALGHNQLTGEIPSCVGQWKEIKTFHVSNNRLTGAIPEGVGSWTHVGAVTISENMLSGVVPSAIKAWTAVSKLSFASNRFTGLPSEVARLTNLTEMDISRNEMTGLLPALGELRNLSRLNASGNSFTGTGSLPLSLASLDLSSNRLEQLPEATLQLTELQTLLLAENRITRWPPRGVLTPRASDGKITDCESQELERRFPWRKLLRLDVSGNALTVVNHPPNLILASEFTSLYVFMGSLAYLDSLADLVCRNCHLSGKLLPPVKGILDVQHLFDVFPEGGSTMCDGGALSPLPGFASLRYLDLRNNSITAVRAGPGSLSIADFSHNNIETLDERWLNLAGSIEMIQLLINGNPRLRMMVRPPSQTCSTSGETARTADPTTYRYVASGYECTGLCRSPRTSYAVDTGVSVQGLCRCLPGWEGSGNSCKVCKQHSYSYYNTSSDPHAVDRKCRQCPANSVTASSGMEGITSCKCVAGTYWDPASEECVWCTQWPFRATEAGATGPSACGCNNTFQGLKEFGGLCGCDDGFHMDRVARSCRRCGYAEDCIWKTDLNRSLFPPAVKKGYWAEPVPDLEAFGGNNVWRCAGSSSCLDGGVCGKNRRGRACGDCAPRTFGMADGPCKACTDISPSRQRITMALGMPVVLVVFTIALHVGITARQKGLDILLHLRAMRSSIKQMVKHLQTVSVIGGFSVSWPPLAKAFFRVLEGFSINLPDIMALGCLWQQTTMHLEVLAKLALPAIMVCCAFLAVPASWLLKRLAARCNRRSWTGAETIGMNHLDALRVLMFLATIFWSTLVANSFEVMTCTPSPNNKVYTVATYPSWQCSLRNTHWLLIALFSLIAALAYVVLPLKMLLYGRAHSIQCLASTELVDRGWYGFLFEDFRDTRLEWVVRIMAKDALVALIPVVLPGQGAAQLLLTAGFGAIHVCMVLQECPFQAKSNTLLEAWNGATAALICVYSAGMGYQKTVGMKDVEELFLDGQADTLYRGRDIGMVVVQVVAIIIPAFFLTYQLLCALPFTRKLLPQCMQPIPPEQDARWLAEMHAEPEELVAVLGRLDSNDMHELRYMLEQSTAMIGSTFASKSSTRIVYLHTRERGDSVRSMETAEVSALQKLAEAEEGKTPGDVGRLASAGEFFHSEEKDGEGGRFASSEEPEPRKPGIVSV